MAGSFVGFGFGAIQGGLFLPFAKKSGNFDRLVVAEIEPEIIEGVRANKGSYSCNVAHADRVEFITMDGVEVLNPTDADDREALVHAIAEAGELATALPSFMLYDTDPAPVACLLAEGLTRKSKRPDLPPAVVYAAENDSRAATRLEALCWDHAPAGFGNKVVFSETVIPKMCTVVLDRGRIEQEQLVPMFPGASRALLVEAYDRILVEDHVPDGFERGITSLVSKRQLDPFAQTKFMGHNAVHAWLGYLAQSEGMVLMGEAGQRDDLMRWALEVFQKEVGPGLIHAHKRTGDPLFTEEGIVVYAKDALKRMVNPFLNDPIERVTRDPVRKLGWEDRLIGAMRLAMDAGIQPVHLAEGTKIALTRAAREAGCSPDKLLGKIWPSAVDPKERDKVQSLLIS
ncbi:MAG: hypothetical protein VW576_09485 [Opitutae bacterium]